MHLTLPSLSSTPAQNVFFENTHVCVNKALESLVRVETNNNLAMSDRAGEVLIADEECRCAQVSHAD